MTLLQGALVSVCVSLVLGGCGGDSAAPTQTQATEQQTAYRWKLITTWPKNLPGLGTAPERMAEQVRKMSNGRLDIKVYGAGELVGAFEVFDSVSRGTAEMGHGAAYYWRGKLPIAAMFSTVPFGMTAQEMNGWLNYGGGMELWRELYQPFGLIPLACGNTGVQMAGWFNREINSVEDLAGLKMRIPGLGGEVFQRAGGTPVALPGGEIFTALQTGVIDATEWVGPYNDLAFGLHTVAKYYYYPGWHEPGPTLEAIVNTDAWNALPEDLRTMLEVAVQATNDDMLSEFTARNKAALDTLVGEHGVELRPLPKDVLERLKAVSEEVVAEAAGENELAGRIYESYMGYLESVRAYHALSEQAYLNARLSPLEQ
ncbi:MAG: TRAP transporter substrate-binding protein [Pseudomonadales bacterium]|jgi:TRAP-type mannitol/chloroaromatic compound transport system substrate-binding protein|nr:TRAP transporter substrate-binding protein [Pseudomonadales bacterium]MDP6469418.1 TRAP transporter substrate-binding protein [Pseudomonadales bacterium]MDP6827260.1 TRAP transporter substrate-binding protein [Pseudomonadales bacterium]MDP6970440.1 TRAP transporter substrate-binding protein [Pseudomonadales bacterium]